MISITEYRIRRFWQNWVGAKYFRPYLFKQDCFFFRLNAPAATNRHCYTNINTDYQHLWLFCLSHEVFSDSVFIWRAIYIKDHLVLYLYILSCKCNNRRIYFNRCQGEVCFFCEVRLVVSKHPSPEKRWQSVVSPLQMLECVVLALLYALVCFHSRLGFEPDCWESEMH